MMGVPEINEGFRQLVLLVRDTDLSSHRRLWFIGCHRSGMLSFKVRSQTDLGGICRFLGVLAIGLVMIRRLPAHDLSVTLASSPQSVAFARYVASLEGRDPFTESGPVAVLIQASAPELYKESALLAIRQAGDNERSEYVIAGIEGDGAFVEEVTARYFKLQEQIENLPKSSVLITPENYKFRFRGELKTGTGGAYVYDITPRKRRPGLFKGQIWIEAVTGAELLVSGRFTVAPSSTDSISFVRETNLDTSGYVRVTHLSFAVPLLGRSELIVEERPLPSTFDVPTLQGSPQHGSTLFNLPLSHSALEPPASVH